MAILVIDCCSLFLSKEVNPNNTAPSILIHLHPFTSTSMTNHRRTNPFTASTFYSNHLDVTRHFHSTRGLFFLFCPFNERHNVVKVDLIHSKHGWYVFYTKLDSNLLVCREVSTATILQCWRCSVQEPPRCRPYGRPIRQGIRPCCRIRHGPNNSEIKISQCEGSWQFLYINTIRHSCFSFEILECWCNR